MSESNGDGKATFAMLLSDAVEAEYDFDRATESARHATDAQAQAGATLGRAQDRVREAIEATAARTGHQADEIALRGGDYVAALVGRAVRTYRLIEADAPPCRRRSPAQETADLIGHRLYAAGCTPEEAGVPATAEAFRDVADEDGFVPASALGAMREAARAQAFAGTDAVAIDNDVS